MLTRGAIIANRYKLLNELGRGACGSVWKALDTTTETEIALKIVNSNF